VNRERQLYYKEFRTRSPAESLKYLVRGSRATRARMNSEALLLSGINAPENILWGKLPGGREYLFTTAVPGNAISQWLRETQLERTPQQLRLRRQLLHALGIFIGRVHATGFIHGDLKPGNVLAALQHERFSFTLINNECNSMKKPPSGRLLLRNLMQLNMLPHAVLSHTDRMRFFCAWRRQMRDVSQMEAKILAVEAYQWAMRRQCDRDQR
jgi:hypothetical protein